MSYRNGTYIAFHANNSKEPTESDIKYYNLLKAWNVRPDREFQFVNSHEKTAAVRDSSMRLTLEHSLKSRLQNSGAQRFDAGSISQNTETHEEKTGFTPWDNRKPLANHRGQSESR